MSNQESNPFKLHEDPMVPGLYSVGLREDENTQSRNALAARILNEHFESTRPAVDKITGDRAITHLLTKYRRERVKIRTR